MMSRSAPQFDKRNAGGKWHTTCAAADQGDLDRSRWTADQVATVVNDLPADDQRAGLGFGPPAGDSQMESIK
jgi:hypothetical protein